MQSTINEEEISFLIHFINRYDEDWNSGKIDDSHHDAVGVVLFLKEKFEREKLIPSEATCPT